MKATKIWLTLLFFSSIFSSYSQADTTPSVAELYRIVLEQKKLIEQQSQRIKTLEQQVGSQQPKKQTSKKISPQKAIASMPDKTIKQDKKHEEESEKKSEEESEKKSVAKDFSLKIKGKYHVALSATKQRGRVGSGTSGDYNKSTVRQDGEIHFEPRLKINEDITVGARVELEAFTTTDQIDEHYLFAETRYGKLRVGAHGSAAYMMYVGVPYATWHFHADEPYFFNYEKPSGSTITYVGSWPDIQVDSNKISFISETLLHGLKLGYSFTPSLDNTGGSRNESGLTSTVDEDGYSYGHSFGMQWSQALDRWKLKLSSGINLSALESDTDGSNTDRKEWNISGQLSYGPITLGAVYTQDNQGKSGDFDRIDYSVAAMYTGDDWKTTLSWGRAKEEIGAGLMEDSLETINLSGNYDLYRYKPLKATMGIFGGLDWVQWDGYLADRRSDGYSFLMGSFLKW
ncbi:porin [Magnetococcales bacterium HHB-1]